MPQEVHMKVYSDERPFFCPIAGCGKAFERKHHLKKHIAYHVKHTMKDSTEVVERFSDTNECVFSSPLIYLHNSILGECLFIIHTCHISLLYF